jgi:hypothetical protein
MAKISTLTCDGIAVIGKAVFGYGIGVGIGPTGLGIGVKQTSGIAKFRPVIWVFTNINYSYPM